MAKKRSRHNYDSNLEPTPPLTVAPLGSTVHYGYSLVAPAASYFNNNDLNRKFRSAKSVTLQPEVRGGNLYQGALTAEPVRAVPAQPAQPDNRYISILLRAGTLRRGA